MALNKVYDKECEQKSFIYEWVDTCRQDWIWKWYDGLDWDNATTSGRGVQKRSLDGEARKGGRGGERGLRRKGQGEFRTVT
jgi:hypothetical protein